MPLWVSPMPQTGQTGKDVIVGHIRQSLGFGLWRVSMFASVFFFRESRIVEELCCMGKGCRFVLGFNCCDSLSGFRHVFYSEKLI